MAVSTYLILDEDGFVVSASVGKVDVEGLDTVRRTAAVGDAWVGWRRQPDGNFTPPERLPLPVSQEAEAPTPEATT